MTRFSAVHASLTFSAAICRGLIEAPRVCRTTSSRCDGFPRLYAAASLKLATRACARARSGRFPAALCRGLIEAPTVLHGKLTLQSSAALCRGLIEAPTVLHGKLTLQSSAAICRGLIEANWCSRVSSSTVRCFPRLYAAAPFKRDGAYNLMRQLAPRFPRLCAAASLKRTVRRGGRRGAGRFSAALCRGLIEARPMYAATSILPAVFRGTMPRPHRSWDEVPHVPGVDIVFPRRYAAASLNQPSTIATRSFPMECVAAMPRSH